ncbi:TetR/AcrR family transcriptional regulator [Klebsiella aerogenes]|uniref:TetR/AcrR family transcriptional regulator n=1 Tax=Klebsiella aerogenes TaxID=548 RepID=UPI000CDD942A|nr:TetR/AcrR family transcriptional regulator [Klebsiella aerogenes]EKW3262004.1 TetR/AcrR family transcriptional regulator [Klebsiella aerogenes]ELS5747032.1 TetR/AcrR family transcriptional regulator [Klebsiella aerogenes]MBY5236514.1 TetR/AcrR family transcriptional regulator [Klebsiella aerogenes]MDQ9495449.1 TetR/AcrR family transcriptional regulator [Klebsiella aerogenes]MEB6560230.1 TetR/AcrR family transcriptional regulator [Klebsiella aerogenes]
MARPRSEEKQQALLRAATEIFAEQGLAASTVTIARKASVSEGTLFHYFENKDALIGAVGDYLLDEMENMLARSLASASPETNKIQIGWNAYIDWALENPEAYATSNKLMVSGKLSEQQMERSMRIGEFTMPQLASIEGLDATQSSEFHGMISTVMANGVIDLAAQKPYLTEAYKRAGYEAMLRAIGLDGSV